MKFIVEGKLPSLNEFIDADRVLIRNAGHCFSKGNELKKVNQKRVISAIQRDLKGKTIKSPIRLVYTFYEPNRKRDKDNIASFAMKVIQDALVQQGIINNDGWKDIDSFECLFDIDKENPRIEVELQEIS